MGKMFGYLLLTFSLSPLASLQASEPEMLRAPREVPVIQAGQIMFVFIKNVIGDKGTVPPVRQIGTKTVTGYGFIVSEEGFITLPYVDPIELKGLTEREALEKIRTIYTDKKLLERGRDRIFVTLYNEARRFSPAALSR